MKITKKGIRNGGTMAVIIGLGILTRLLITGAHLEGLVIAGLFIGVGTLLTSLSIS